MALATLASFAVEAKSLASQADDGTSRHMWGPDFVTKPSLIDQTQEQTDLFWRSASSQAEIEPPSALEQDSELALSWIRKHLGTKSPYPHESRHTGPLTDTPEGYELAQLHLICRHGTRFPSPSNAIAFQKLTERLKQFTAPGTEWLRHWRSQELYPMEKGNLLAAKGDSDLYQIGHRFAIRYRDFLDQHPYDANTYEFQSSSKARCSQSAYAFSVGFFKGRITTDPGAEKDKNELPVQPIDIETLPIGIDKELAVKYACPRWLESVKNSPAIVRETLTYNEQFLPKLAERLSAMFTSDDGSVSANITIKDVGMIYSICAFEVSLYDNDQTWCQLLRQSIQNVTASSVENQHSNFVRFEISGDIDDYYTHGPGIPFNRHLGCVLGTSLVDSIEMVLDPNAEKYTTTMKFGDDDDDGPHRFRGLFKFGHAETIFFFSSFLGLYDQRKIPLKGNMTSEQYEQREFWSSKLSPFAANMAFEIYRSKAGDAPKKRRLTSEDMFTEARSHSPIGLIRLLVNEEPMIIPGCGSTYFCDWATFKEILRQAGTGCDFDGCCTSLHPPSDVNGISNTPVCLTVDPVTA
ncbi:PHOsphatase [Mortierella sp. NVP85]|nr:PHOsphatase [Mortierella sp. NVP85]